MILSRLLFICKGINSSYFAWLLLSTLAVSSSFYNCSNDNRKARDIAKIKLSLEVERFDQEFCNSHPSDLPSLKKRHPYLFPETFNNKIWADKMIDPLFNELCKETALIHEDFTETSKSLEQFFKYVKFYFKGFNPPKTLTLINEVDYRNRVIVTDSLLLIGLDNYLGRDHEFYTNIPIYLRQNFSKENIVCDVSDKYARLFTHRHQTKTFLDQMIYYGKITYFMEQTVPWKTAAEILGYTPEELKWAEDNEEQIWTYFIERELLYSTQADLLSRFLYPAPYSKFYLELDSESPGRLGQYIGWKIVSQYALKTNAEFKEVLNANEYELFKVSKYKPKKLE